MHTFLENSIVDIINPGLTTGGGTVAGSTYVDTRICQNTIIYADVGTVTAGSIGFLEVLAATNEGGSTPTRVGTVDMSEATAGSTGVYAAEVRTAFLDDTFTHLTGRVIINTGGSANVSIWSHRMNLRNLPPEDNGCAGTALFMSSEPAS